MNFDTSFISYFMDSGLIIKAVVLLLVSASIMSWTFIFQRLYSLKNARTQIREFEDLFWSGADLNKIYSDLAKHDDLEGMEYIFVSGFKEFTRLRKQPGIQPAIVMEGAQRAMRIARSQETEKLEKHLSFLATVGTTSTYVGLFGTVLGIIDALHTLGSATQASIATVAPGMSEALVTTAMGLFAAIPAVIFYNRLSSEVDRVLNQYDIFQEEFSGILYRQTHTTTSRVPENEYH
ncbi:MAG TPA: protein TolQ [Gammaproteobacteria bacterium]|nr:protein TolQ [Gammaproteobacteria bacterium]